MIMQVHVKPFRMAHYLAVAILFWIVAFYLPTPMFAQPQTLCWKAGNVMFGAWIGYRIDRALFRDEFDLNTSWQDKIRRSIIVSAAMLTIGMGL